MADIVPPTRPLSLYTTDLAEQPISECRLTILLSVI